MEISRRRFLQVGGLSALAMGMASYLTETRPSTNRVASEEKGEDSSNQLLWNHGSPYIGCSTTYFNKLNPTAEEQWLELVHFHMYPKCRDRFLFHL